jgi:hypothetical protein
MQGVLGRLCQIRDMHRALAIVPEQQLLQALQPPIQVSTWVCDGVAFCWMTSVLAGVLPGFQALMRNQAIHSYIGIADADAICCDL